MAVKRLYTGCWRAHSCEQPVQGESESESESGKTHSQTCNLGIGCFDTEGELTGHALPGKWMVKQRYQWW